MQCFKKLICFMLGTAMLFCLSACNSPADNLSVAEEEQNFRFAATAEDVARIPYTYSGESGGWEVLLQVREATDSEKEFFLRELETDRAAIEENYKVHHIMTEELYELSIEDYTARKNDLSENPVYISTLVGQYTGEQDIHTAAKSLTYKMLTEDDKVLFVGGRDITSLNAPWYSARSTERGDYASGMFVPALEGCKLVLQYEDVKVEIPLALKQEAL